MPETRTHVSDKDAPNLSELTENEHIKRFLSSKLFKYFSTDPATKITAATAVIAVGSFVVRLLDYLRWKGYLSVFSMDVRYADYSASYGVSEFLLHAIVFVGFMVATSLSYLVIESFWFGHGLQKTIDSIQRITVWLMIWRTIKEIKEKIPVVLLVLFVNSFLNFLLWSFTASAEIIKKSSLLDWGIVLVILDGLEFIAAGILLVAHNAKVKKETKEKKEKESEKEQLIDAISKSIRIKRPLVVDVALNSVLMYLFMLCALAYFSGTREAYTVERFAFVEDKYAVICQVDSCFWTVLSSKEGDVLHLDTTKQKFFEIVGAEIKYCDYKDVEIDYD